MSELTANDLTEDELRAVRRATEAVAARDYETVRELLVPNIPDVRDLFWEADNYGRYGRLTLQTPPGDVREWGIWGVERADDSGDAEIDVDMWSEQEGGRSDLTLGLRLKRRGPDGPTVMVELLHVL
ncbi:MAG: hypothetical protein QOG41_659 [Thermoleophilaceae bacterium]|jgi:hypothetical protein|nr:hypothetical protein [Thermoleophilaceae bacterium]